MCVLRFLNVNKLYPICHLYVKRFQLIHFEISELSDADRLGGTALTS